MCPTDLPVLDGARAERVEVLYHHPTKAGPSWWECLQRLLTGGALAAIPLFIYALMSFLNPLRPAFTTTEAVLAVVLLGLVISRE
jgi:hypothetical protein